MFIKVIYIDYCVNKKISIFLGILFDESNEHNKRFMLLPKKAFLSQDFLRNSNVYAMIQSYFMFILQH